MQADSPVRARGMLADLNGELALVVVNVDTPDDGLIEHVRALGVPVLAFGLERSMGPLARALDAGADDAISLGAPVTHLVGRAAQLASQASGYRHQASGLAPDSPSG